MSGATPGNARPTVYAPVAFRVRGVHPGAHRHPLHRTTIIRVLRDAHQLDADEGVRATARLALALATSLPPSEWHITEALRLHHPACRCPHGRRPTHTLPRRYATPQEGGTP